jgi:hypothetical protein
MNVAPTIGGLLFDNPAPHTSSTLQVQLVNVADPDGDPLSIQYDWRVNGTTVRLYTTDATTDVLDLSQPGWGDRGDVIELIVTASDGSASTSVSASLTVVATPSELYADYQQAVSQANQAYLDAIGAAVAWRDAALASARQSAEAAAAALYLSYEQTVSAALLSYESTLEELWEAYGSALAMADATYASVTASAMAIYEAALELAQAE